MWWWQWHPPVSPGGASQHNGADDYLTTRQCFHHFRKHRNFHSRRLWNSTAVVSVAEEWHDDSRGNRRKLHDTSGRNRGQRHNVCRRSREFRG